MSLKKWMAVLLSHTVVALLAAILATFLAMDRTNVKQEVPSKLDTLEQLILDQFVGEVDQTKIQNAAASAMISALGDRWSYYIPAEYYDEYQEKKQNAYIGLGITITPRQDGTGLEITDISEGAPAEEAGILPGDVIVGVDNRQVVDMEMDEIRALIRGEEGTIVNISVMRMDEEQIIAVTRKRIYTAVAIGKMVGEDIGLVRIVNFNDNCSEQTIAAIEDLMKQGAKKLIFDVRYNPGGYASELKKVLDYLLPEGCLYQTEDYSGNKSEATSDAQCLQIPMAVLINSKSYSAAELFAAVLKEYDAALLVGEQTVGKGYYQVTYTLADGSIVGLSVGKYYTSTGKNLDGIGLTPDKVVPVDENMAAAIKAGKLEPEDDYQIQAAIAALNGK